MIYKRTAFDVGPFLVWDAHPADVGSQFLAGNGAVGRLFDGWAAINRWMAAIHTLRIAPLGKKRRRYSYFIGKLFADHVRLREVFI